MSRSEHSITGVPGYKCDMGVTEDSGDLLGSTPWLSRRLGSGDAQVRDALMILLPLVLLVAALFIGSELYSSGDAGATGGGG